MLKAGAVGTKGGRPVQIVVLGLSKVNIERLQAGQPIMFSGEDVRLPAVEFVIFAGDTEASMARQLEELIGPGTDVRIDPRTRDA